MEKAALITGAAKRLGREMALSLAARGYDIALHYRSSAKEAKETAREIKGLGVQCETFKADLTSASQTRSLFRRVVRRFSHLSLIVNNASVFERAGIVQTKDAQFERDFAIHLFAPFILTRDFARSGRKGSVINILDSRVKQPGTTHVSYLLSKRALQSFTVQAAMDLGPQLRVNAIAPGVIIPPEGKGGAYVEKLTKNVPLKVGGTVEGINDALHFLLEHDFITGQTIYVDGGENLGPV